MNERISMALGVVLCATWASACTEDFAPGSRVDKLRVLAVQADTPFAEPGQEVRLSALAFDPEERALSWGWGTCQASESTAAVDCLREASFDALRIGAGLTEHSVTVPAASSSYVGVVVIACPGTIERGTTQTMPVACRDASGILLSLSEFELGLKRIFVRESSLNQNPSIDGVTLDGAAWEEARAPLARCERTEANACVEFGEHVIEVRAPTASELSVDARGLPIREQAVTQFYATGGDFDDDYKLASDGRNAWRPRRGDAGKRITFWLVVRDDRGGVSWLTRQLQVP